MSYLALFMDSELNVIGNKKFKPTDKFINFKKGTFKIRLDAYLYKIKDTIIYGYIYPTDEHLLIDIDEKTGKTKVNEIEPIKKNKDFNSVRLVLIKEKIENGDLHLLVAESIIGQLARFAIAQLKTNWLFLILALGAGIAIGYIAGSSLGHQISTTIIRPIKLALISPSRPLDKLTKRIFLLSIISRKLKEDFSWAIIGRIMSFCRNTSNLLTM